MPELPILALAGFATTTAVPAFADSGSGGAVFSPYFEAEEAATFSKDIEKMLAAKGARVAIVFRTGRTRDKLPDWISYIPMAASGSTNPFSTKTGL